VLYLAEVQKKAGFIGSGKPEFKLLACQRAEQSWSSVPGDEVVAAPDDATYNAGALVMVELSNNRQIQRHYEAGRSLVTILQTFSNLSKKYKTQEEEIEQWKQSLTFQSQELNRREMEMESRQEQLEQAEADLENLEQQRQATEQAQAELEQLRADLERKNQDLEGAWAHLNGEMRRLEERQAELGDMGLDEAQLEQLQEALNRLTNAITPTESIRQQLDAACEHWNQQQAILEHHQQSLTQQQQELTQQQQQTQQQINELESAWQGWRDGEIALADRRTELKLQQALIVAHQERITLLSEQLRDQGALHKQIYDLLNTTDKVRLSKKVDVAALEAMPLEALQTLVSELEQDLEKVSRFVIDQEEELTLQQQAIDELKQKIEQSSEFDRLQLETELADEQDRYQMLNETLVGQRRNLLEREEVLSQHQALLRRRQGHATEEAPASAVELEPVLDKIDDLRQQTNDELQALETQVKQMQESVSALKTETEQMAVAQGNRREELQVQDQQVRERQQALGDLQGRVTLYGELLPAFRERLDQLKQTLDAIASSLAQLQESSDYQLQAITELRQTVSTLAAEGTEQLATP